jgi:sugar diacid utilization regulator
MAPLAGLHMLHARSASDFGERRNSDLIRTLLDDPAHASFVAAQLGVDATQGFAVAAFSFAGPMTGSLESVREIQRLLQLVTTVCNLQFNTSHCALLDSIVYALLPSQGAHPRARQRRAVQEIGAYGHTISSHPLIAAVGGIAPRLEELPRSRAEALQTLQFVGRRDSATVKPGGAGAAVTALVEDCRVPLNLLKVGEFLGENDLADHDAIATIAAQDAERQSDYLQTLRAYFDSNGNISTMAARLHVHNNTIRYRVAQLEKNFGLDDPQQRLWLWLRLTTMDLAR